MSMTENLDNPTTQTVNAGGMWVLALCFLVVLLDGLDTTSISFIGPVLARQWGVFPAALTPAFIATSLGAVVGYMSCGPLAQRFGLRTIGLSSVAIFGLGTLATTGIWDVMSLSVVRFVSAIGLGGAIPVAVAAATDVVVSRHKETATMLVTSGVSAGAVVGGVIGGPLTRDYGWQAIFIVGGVLPLILLPLFARILKQNSQLLARSGVARTKANTVAQLFMQGLGARTGFLWLFSFLIFLLMFAMAFWVPTLLLEFGFAREEAALGAAAFGMGGLIGNIVMMSLVAIVGVKRLLAITTLLAMACVLTISKAEISGTFVLVMIAGLGAGLVTGGVGQSALAVSLYPRSLRTTGVGWALALGRTGSIVGPAIGGLLLSFGWSARDIILMALFPAILAILVLAVIGMMERTREAA